jgi:hypothetical protein
LPTRSTSSSIRDSVSLFIYTRLSRLVQFAF